MPTDRPVEAWATANPGLGIRISSEWVAREQVVRSLRPGLRWLVDHPRLLGWAYRLRLTRRPVMRTYPDGRIAD